MSETEQPAASQDDTVKVTLQLDPKIYQAFLQKAEKAGVGIEPFLSSTLSIVLGCRVFNETHACSPRIAVVKRPPDDAQKSS